MKKIFLLLVLSVFLLSCSNTPAVKNVIFMIGDGMGLTHVFAARIAAVGPDGYLAVDRFPYTGFARTYSANKLITDSAAAGTALATGHKTNNGMIGVTPDSQQVRSVLQACQSIGMSTGLVATSTITNATPASFTAHVTSRADESQIAEQIVNSKINVLFGGGKEFFIPSSEPNSKRKDNLNLLEKASSLGYSYIETREQLLNAKMDHLLGLFQYDALTTQPPEPSLAEMSTAAINILSQNPNGFFLMIEGSQIDWASHTNKKDYLVHQMKAFNDAVDAARQFASQNMHTLVVVTADHETGGLTIPEGNLDGSQLGFAWATQGHTAAMVPVYAFGPGAEQFSGTHDNTDIPKIIAKLLRINNFAVEL